MPAFLRSLARTAAPGLLFFLAACQPSPVATVNGVAIPRAELEAQLRVLKGMPGAAPDEAALRRQALDQLVQRALLLQAARRDGADKDPALQAQLKQRQQEARAQLERGIHEAQERLKTLDRDLEEQAVIEAWARRQSPGLTVTAQDLRQAYGLRAQRQPLPPFPAVRDQLMQQVIMERLLERERPHADIRLSEGQP
jgi:hypothetical protein